MNDSGSTFLQNSLSECKNIVSFKCKAHPHGIEGQGIVGRDLKVYPRDNDHQCIKVFSEKKELWLNEKNFQWGKIIKKWNNAWKRGQHFNSANPKIFLEKTPFNIFMVSHFLKYFKDVKFIIMHRNPYAICEGIMRTTKRWKSQKYPPDRCIKHWVACTKQQMENINKLGDKAICFKYEDMCENIKEVEDKIKNFIKELNDINFAKKVHCHSMDGTVKRPITNLNERHIRNLSKEQIKEINNVLENHNDLMEFWRYKFIE